MGYRSGMAKKKSLVKKKILFRNLVLSNLFGLPPPPTHEVQKRLTDFPKVWEAFLRIPNGESETNPTGGDLNGAGECNAIILDENPSRFSPPLKVILSQSLPRYIIFPMLLRKVLVFLKGSYPILKYIQVLELAKSQRLELFFWFSVKTGRPGYQQEKTTSIFSHLEEWPNICSQQVFPPSAMNHILNNSPWHGSPSHSTHGGGGAVDPSSPVPRSWHWPSGGSLLEGGGCKQR